MPVLRLTQTTVETDKYRVELAIERDGQPRSIAISEFQFRLSSQEQEDIRWYLEDFLQYDLRLEAGRGLNIEKKIEELGIKLFENVFYSNNDVHDLWATLSPRINDTRIEIVTEVSEATIIPWELLRDPKTQIFLALRASAFVRTHPTAAQRPKATQIFSDSARILMVICRADGEKDESRNLISRQIEEKLEKNAHGRFQLDILDPPTYSQLGRVLRNATNQGNPYHIVHFDGHGIYSEMLSVGASAEQVYTISPFILGGLRSGSHGYLLFENPMIPENIQLVDGSTIGNLLVETDVPLLVLNACRSAHAEPLTSKNQSKKTLLSSNSHSQVRAFGTLAQEVMDTGVVGIVAMRYNIYVDTAAQFISDLYEALTQGLTLGKAVTQGRKQLKEQPLRNTSSGIYPLQDWSVPLVYESIPFVLFSRSSQLESIVQEKIKISEAEIEAVDLTKAITKSEVDKGVIQVFEYDWISVNSKGEKIKEEKSQTRYFTEDLGSEVVLEMVAIPSGKFFMGTENNEIERLCKKFKWEGYRHEKPQHKVVLHSFFMGKFQITQEQWETVASLPKVNRDLELNPSEFIGNKRPIEKVSWYDAVEFCDRISRHTGRKYRLPSEAEWEYACRAGTITPFHFGDTITNDLANYDGTKTYAEEFRAKECPKETTNVGSFTPNAFGLYDMHGNVWEWCLDNWHDNYSEALPSGGARSQDGDNSFSPVRGGSFLPYPFFCRSASRNRDFKQDGILGFIGFRVVCEIDMNSLIAQQP